MPFSGFVGVFNPRIPPFGPEKDINRPGERQTGLGRPEKGGNRPGDKQIGFCWPETGGNRPEGRQKRDNLSRPVRGRLNNNSYYVRILTMEELFGL